RDWSSDVCSSDLPASIEDCDRWGMVLFSADRTLYVDRSGNGNDFEQPGASGAVPNLSELNGRPALEFNGNSHYMFNDGSLAASASGLNSPFTFVAVCQWVQNVGVDTLLAWAEGEASPIQIGANPFNDPATWRFLRTDDEGAQIVLNNLGEVTTDPQILVAAFDGTTLRVYRNGFELSLGPFSRPSSTTVSAVYLARRGAPAAAGYWTGKVAFDALFGRALGNDEIQILSKALGAVYGITVAVDSIGTSAPEAEVSGASSVQKDASGLSNPEASGTGIASVLVDATGF